MQRILNKSVSEEYLKMLDAVSEVAIIAYTDRKGRITYANENFCKISGYNFEELQNKDHRILNSGFHGKEFFKEMYETVKSGRIWRAEVRNRRKDGSLYWVDTQIIPVFCDLGEIESFASIRFDITEKKLIEKTRLEMEKLATSIEVAKAVSHEVNNPLTVIDLCCFSLARNLNVYSPEEIRKKIEKIAEQSKRIAEKVRQLNNLEPVPASEDSVHWQ